MSILGGNKKQSPANQPAQPQPDPFLISGARPVGRFDGIIRIVLTFVIISLFALTVLVIYIKTSLSTAEATTQIPTVSGTIYASFTLLSKGPLTYNNSQFIADFARLRYNIYNSANTTAFLKVYTSSPIRPIYLLNVEGYCTGCFVESTLFQSLNQSLLQYGLIQNKSSFNYVDINNIDSIPKRAIIIIPSGLMPNILLPNVTYTNGCPKYTNSTVITLLNEGDIIMYVGANFSRMVTCTGQTVQTPAKAIYTISSYLNTTSQFQNNTGNVLYVKNYSFSFRFGDMYGASAATNIGQNGSMVALSEYPSVGWPNSNLLAGDIAKVLASRYWIPLIANGSAIIPGGQHVSSNITIFTTNMLIRNNRNITAIVNNSYAMVRVITNNSKNYSEYDIPVPIKMKGNGMIGIPAVIGLGYQAQLTAQIFNSSTNRVIAYAQVVNSNITQIPNLIIPFGQTASTPVYVQSSFVLQSGYYLVNLTDQNNNQYSSALFFISGANVTPVNLNFKNGSFTFYVLSNGVPVTGVPYTINVNGAYNASGFINDGQIKYTLPKGTVVSYGQKNFKISFLANTFGVPYNYANPGLKIPPFYIEVAIELIIVIVITKVLVPPNVDEFYIDVPDVRPVQKQLLKENTDALADVFNRVNSYYHWKNMPLTVDEVKTGISNYLKYGNTKVSVTARNAYAMLNRMVAKGVVQEAGDYYALSKWIQDSHHGIDYLVIYRKLRDFCVANAMLFTELDTSSNLDMIITNKSTQNFIKIFSGDMKIKDIEIKTGARMFITFLNEEARLQFLDKLHSSYGTNAELLKMAISYGNIRLIDTDHIDQLKL